MRTYKCQRCKDVGWILSKDEKGRDWSTRCECLKKEIERRKNPPKEWTFDVHKNDPRYNPKLDY